MTERERCEAAAEECMNGDGSHETYERVRDRIARERADARAKTLEDAAQIADSVPHSARCATVAERIRALK